MTTLRSPVTLEESKIQATILLKWLASDNTEIAAQAAKRFQRLPEFKILTPTELLQIAPKHKQALTVIALENDFKSWVDLKHQINFIQGGGFLHKWFANYIEAKAELKINGGFLLPYKKHFFICETEYIQYLGLDSHDADWKLINYDWAQPSDQKASERLYRKWMQVQENHHE